MAARDERPIEVVAAGGDDVEAVRELRLAALTDAPDAFWSTLDEEQDQPAAWWRDRVVGDTRWLLARRAGTATGLCAVAPDHRGRAGVVSLVSFWVTPQGRGTGVGDALLDAALREGRDLGARQVALDVGDHNAAAAAIYARHGFTPSGATGRFLPPREHITEHELVRAP